MSASTFDASASETIRRHYGRGNRPLLDVENGLPTLYVDASSQHMFQLMGERYLSLHAAMKQRPNGILFNERPFINRAAKLWRQKAKVDDGGQLTMRLVEGQLRYDNASICIDGSQKPGARTCAKRS